MTFTIILLHIRFFDFYFFVNKLNQLDFLYNFSLQKFVGQKA